MIIEKESLRIVFLGTPEFAVESLSKLYENGYNIVGVITMPDKIGGRGHKVIQSPVKEYALSKGLKVMQPVNLKDTEFVSELKSLNADLQIVIAFRMLPEVVWSMPPLGTFNLHASLLPRYRGAAPINWAVMNGDKETGVTTFFLKHEIDTGDIIQQEKLSIGISDNVEIVYDRLMKLGAKMVIETVEGILNDTIAPISQDKLCVKGIEATPAPKIFKETCRIDWDKNAMTIYNHIRGLSPYPAAWSTFVEKNGKELQFKVFEASIPDPTANISDPILPGAVKQDGHKLNIMCGDMPLEIISLQVAGKKRISADEFIRGYDINDWICK